MMASFLPSTFTTGERRKKVITYGKLSRLPSRRASLNEDAPSPERPHKHTAVSDGPPGGLGGVTKSVRAPESVRAPTTSSDVFDVPSEDEFGFQSTPPAKRLVVQRGKTEGGPRANIAKETASVPIRPAVTTSRPPQKSIVAKPAESRTRLLQEQIRSQRPAQEKHIQHKVLPTSTTSQTKASQATEARREASASGQRLQRSNTSSKNISRATTPGLSIKPVPKPQFVKTASSATLKKTARPTVGQPANLDVFDVPSDDEEASLPIPEAPRQTPRQVSKGTARQHGASKVPSFDISQKMPVKSSELGNLQSRKRKGSVSLATAPKSVTDRQQETLRTQRDRKVPKRENGTSPAHELAKAPVPSSGPQAATVEATINKPRRTRTRTVPVVSQPAILKGQSSPAVLHKMIPDEHAPSILPEDIASEIPASDDTMYDIPDSMTTPVRSTPLRRTTTSTPDSVTPRQKDLFSTLLGGSTAPKTPASALASLQLTDKKPRSLLGALARSRSDVAYSSQSRKTRLIDTLKDEDTSSEEEDSGSDEEADSTITATYDVDEDKTPMQAKRTILERNIEDLDRDKPTATDSQTSQMITGAVTRPKLTYATQRSYLQEANPEDEFLMSMDLDDNWKMDSQTVSTDDEDGPTSQPRTHHELRKYGQNTMFSWDMEESIREISDESNRSGRRSAMMDLCTKMADAGFVSQLLDSGFMHKLFERMTSTGDVIFDFIVAVSVLFVLQTKPAFAVVDQMYRSGVTTTLINLVDKDADMSKIARDRKSNMSKIAQESLTDFRTLILAAKVWSSTTPEKVSPQLLALKTIDILVRNLRESGSTEALLTPADVSKIVNVCSLSSKRIEASKSSVQDCLALELAISTLETVSIADQDHSTWPTKVLQQLSEASPVFFGDNGLSKTVEAMKLCMNLTNNKPKACQPFSTQTFVQSLIRFIVARFDLLHTGGLDSERRTRVLAALTLSLGAMINLAELSDQARLNAINDVNSIEVLVKTFVVGSERAAEANSVEESEISVVIGFLTVLLGNLCLNSTVRSILRSSLPGQQLDLLLEKMKEFALIHEHVDKRTASRFEGSEGQETLNNYYIRIMHVVKKLESAKA
ncbi:hypothetical protein BU25DRAFT_408218 [Macroventuria anomochaeta]|uniref:Uncharacterized protein n=1 Tax=Macroventuria anomochaeta TaxID=301207 RepID=A0ACB6S859_9PLEO|nr:uncharacterized protein BU25DRAFT_408218 [Macroventuria anomochaeta]KAF2630244.1 hypothetical protein BU25DRAFT_408218 [Macroventuria anomochaeta]